MQESNALTPMSEILNLLRGRGYNEDFMMDDKGIKNNSSGERYKPEDLTIVKVYRFEGESDPADMAVVYAIESKKGQKGIFLDAFGTYADYDGQKMADYMSKVKILKNH